MLKSGKARALVVNSGNANAFTGKTGEGKNLLSGETGVPFPKIARHYKQAGIAWVVLFGSVASVEAQVDTGRIVGRVSDPSGAVLAGAKVTITNVQTGIAHTTETNPFGRYESVPLRIGRYRVEAERSGFKRSVRDGVVLQIQETAVVDLQLELGAVTQEVSVSADAPLLTTAEATQGQVIDNQKMVDLPLNGRDYIQLALLSAGANQTAPGARVGGFSGSGTRPPVARPNSALN